MFAIHFAHTLTRHFSVSTGFKVVVGACYSSTDLLLDLPGLDNYGKRRRKSGKAIDAILHFQCNMYMYIALHVHVHGGPAQPSMPALILSQPPFLHMIATVRAYVHKLLTCIYSKYKH